MRLFNRGLLIIVTVLAVLAGTPAHAILKIDITQGNVDPLQIAIPEFSTVVEGRSVERLRNGLGGDIAVSEIGAAVGKVIAEDLRNSGLFAPLDKSLFIQSVDSVQVQPRFADWRIIDAQALVTGRATLQQDGRLKVEFRLWDVLAETQMTGYVFATTARNWRRVSHMVADAIYKRLTGEDGYFDTRIVYVSESGARNRRVKRLAIMDQDGARHRYLTDGGHLVLTPRFSPTSQEITYLSYFGDRPRVYLFNIDSGKQEVLGDFPGMTFAPRFSPDGNKVIMSLARNGNSDIYVMDLRSRETERLTKHPSIDTSPSYSPDSKRITFNSDRGGTQQLYVADADGRNVKRISFGDGRYATPVWSPRGDLIAFTKMRQGRFYIGVMRVDGSGERLLSESFLDEGPTWSPNGRVLMFFRQEKADDRGRGGSTRLWSVDLTGYNERLVPTPMEASDPAWSPLIK